MFAKKFVLDKYLSRIGFSSVVRADMDTVRGMMLNQLFSVPFENLDVLSHYGVSMIPDEIVEKIINRGRGGYCYEVNGIFSMALQALGINHYFVAARPMTYQVRKPKTHMAIILLLDNERWLCDLGFGSHGIREPLRLGATGEDTRQGFDRFMVSKDDDGEYLLKAFVDGNWSPQYSFNLYPQEWIDFYPANYMNSTHPDSIFLKSPIIVIHNPEGRVILNGDMLKIISRGVPSKRIISQDEYLTVLSQYFGLLIQP